MPHAGLIRFPGPPRAPTHPGLPAAALRALPVPIAVGPPRGSRIAPPGRSDQGMAMRAATVGKRYLEPSLFTGWSADVETPPVLTVGFRPDAVCDLYQRLG
jgi:hypothetical protein